MKKSVIILLILILAVAVGLYFVLQKKNEPKNGQQEQEVSDPNYVEYADAMNHVKLMHHKDWQATSSTGFIRLMPKSSQGQVSYVQIELWATDAKVQQLGFANANSAPVGKAVVRYINQETQVKDSQGKVLPYKNTKTLMHWPVTADRNVIFEVVPGADMNNVSEPVKKIVESLKFDQ